MHYITIVSNCWYLCIYRVMEYALPYKRELDTCRQSLSTALNTISAHNATIDQLRDDAARKQRMHQVALDGMSVELNSCRDALASCNAQLEIEFNNRKELQRQFTQLQFDNQLYRQQVCLV